MKIYNSFNDNYYEMILINLYRYLYRALGQIAGLKWPIKYTVPNRKYVFLPKQTIFILYLIKYKIEIPSYA